MGTDKGCGALSPAGAHVARYYRFQDAGGGTHIVDSIDDVPRASRANAQCIEYAAEPDAPNGLSGVLAHAQVAGRASVLASPRRCSSCSCSASCPARCAYCCA